MSHHCFNCSKEVILSPNGRVGRSDTCPSCDADLHACLNCMFYDQNANNQCREPQADRVVDKDRRNFCDYFSFRSGQSLGTARANKGEHLKALDDLFKK